MKEELNYYIEISRTVLNFTNKFYLIKKIYNGFKFQIIQKCESKKIMEEK